MRGREHRRAFLPGLGAASSRRRRGRRGGDPRGLRGGNPALFRTAAATGGVTGSVKVTGQR